MIKVQLNFMTTTNTKTKPQGEKNVRKVVSSCFGFCIVIYIEMKMKRSSDQKKHGNEKNVRKCINIH